MVAEAVDMTISMENIGLMLVIILLQSILGLPFLWYMEKREENKKQTTFSFTGLVTIETIKQPLISLETLHERYEGHTRKPKR